MHYYRPPTTSGESDPNGSLGLTIELKLVNRIRERLKDWRGQGCPGATRTTLELLNYWRRDGRKHRLFFAQLEGAKTIVFLTEARTGFLQGISAVTPARWPRGPARPPSWACWRRGAF
jgi:type III restriction enzyme